MLLLATSVSAAPQYRLFDEEVEDIPIEVEVTQYYVVSGVPSEAELRAFLLKTYGAVAERAGFDHHEHPTSVYLYVYATEKDRNHRDEWLAMLAKTPVSTGGPEVTMHAGRIADLRDEPVVRHGLAEPERRRLFLESMRAAARAGAEVDRRLPEPDGIDQAAYRAWARRWAELSKKLEEEETSRVCRTFRLGKDECDQIVVEGFEKGWPQR